MNKAIRMASNSMDYFTVEPFIESSHRKDLSRFMAFLYVTNYFDKHHIAPDNFILPELDTLCTPQTFSLRELATATQTPMSLMLKLNRQYRKQIVPHLPHPHCFTIPKSKTANFNAYLIKLAEEAEQKRIQDSMVRVQKLIDKFRPDSTKYQVLVMDGVLTVLDSAGKKIDPDAPIKTDANGQNATGNRWVFYTVKKGDALYLLSDLFDANLADVKRWNKLRSNTIVRGQRLKFLVPANKYGLYSSINRMSATQKQKLRRKD
jgi:membrane-bound lytic murein transglycosylase D